MTERRIGNPIINSPFDAPTRHFRFDDEGIVPGDQKPGEPWPRVFEVEIDPDARAGRYAMASRPCPDPGMGTTTIGVINRSGDEIVHTDEVERRW